MFFLYLVLWLIFSMRLSIGIMVAGIILSAAVYRFACAYMGYSIANDYKFIRKGFLAIQYAFIFLWEASKSVIAVLEIAFKPKVTIEPCILYFRTDLKTNQALVVLANSVTLMPGSVVVALENGVYCIHCLDPKLVENIENSAPVRQLRKLEE
jgi:multicomponent Na+:H+ antiporter subunit E